MKKWPVEAPVRVGVIGAGAIATRQHLPELSVHPHARIHAVASRSPAHSQAVADQYHVAHVYPGDEGWKRLIDDPALDAVLISTPSHLREEIATAAALAGKHLLIEKPIATSVAAATRIVEATRSTGVLCMIGHQRCLKPFYRELRGLLAANSIGSVYMLHATLGLEGPEYWAPEADWFFDPTRAVGGAVMDLGIHMADLVPWLLQRMPQDVVGVVSHVEKPTSLEDQGICTLRFADGCLATIAVSWAMHPSARRVEVFGSLGRILADETATDGLVLTREKPDPGQQFWRFAPPRLNTLGIPMYGVATAFITALVDGTPPPVTAEDGLCAVAVVEAWYRAASTGHVCIVHDPRADVMHQTVEA